MPYRQFSQNFNDPDWFRKMFSPGGVDASQIGTSRKAKSRYQKGLEGLSQGGYNVMYGANFDPRFGTLGGYKQQTPMAPKVWNFAARPNTGGGGLRGGKEAPPLALGGGGYGNASAPRGEVRSTLGGANVPGQWDRYLGGGGGGGQRGGASDSRARSGPTPLGMPAPGAAQGMAAQIGKMSPEIMDWYGAMLNQGVYGQQGMETILGPSEQAQDMILQRLDPYTQMMLGLYDTQTKRATDRAQVEGADRRRRVSEQMGDEFNRIGVTRPGVAAQLGAQTMTPLYQDQASRIYDVGQGRLAQEQGLRAGAEDVFRGTVLDRGQARSDLQRENMRSKLMGLQGMSGARMDDASLLGSRYWDTTDPMDKQLDYSTRMAQLGQGISNQASARDQQSGLERMKYGADLQAFLMQFENELNQPEAWETFLGYLSQFSPIGGGR